MIPASPAQRTFCRCIWSASKSTRSKRTMEAAVLVIGVGNEYRSDDGVGLAVLRVLKAAGLPQTCFIESNGDAMGLLEAWAAATNVILIDAVASGAAPGTIHRL